LVLWKNKCLIPLPFGAFLALPKKLITVEKIMNEANRKMALIDAFTLQNILSYTKQAIFCSNVEKNYEINF
jgi:hypothetical protein